MASNQNTVGLGSAGMERDIGNLMGWFIYAPLDQESEGTARCWVESVPSLQLVVVAGPRSITNQIVL
jgi:hypothetical protein